MVSSGFCPTQSLISHPLSSAHCTSSPSAALKLVHRPSSNLTIHHGELSLLACGISIILQYMNDTLGQFEEVLAGCDFLLQCCGRATCLASVYQMWSLCTNALYLFETMHWPNQPAETRMHITTPEPPRKLSTILRAEWEPSRPRLGLALAALVRFKAWFLENFDAVAHRDTLTIVNDCILIFATAVDLVELHVAAHPPDHAEPAAATASSSTS